MYRLHFFRVGTLRRGPKGMRSNMAGYAQMTRRGVVYPPVTRREAKARANLAGARAVFHRRRSEAEEAVQ